MLLVAAFLVGISAASRSSEAIVRVYADHNNDTHIVLEHAKETVVRCKPDQWASTKWKLRMTIALPAG